MKKWTQLEKASLPDGSVMGLFEHDGTYVIRVDGRELMSTRHFASEELLATVACAPLLKKKGARVLIGGLGLGFTLRAALKSLAPEARVTVAEILPDVVAWNRNEAYPLAAASLADPRTTVELTDVAKLIGRSAGMFDAILLDADNNTTAMNTEGNKSLYTQKGLSIVQAALRPGGCVGYWSAEEDPLFAKQMRKAGFRVELQATRAHTTGGNQHMLLFGWRQ